MSQRHSTRLSLQRLPRPASLRMSFLGAALALAALVATSGCGMATSPGSGGNGSGQSASQLTASSTSVSFGSVAIGSPASQTVTLKDMGPGNITISGLAVMGAGFTMANGGPTTLTAGQSVTVSVNFTPKVAGAAQGTLSVLSDAVNSTMDIALAGTGVAGLSSQLQASATSLSFGSLAVGNSISQQITLTDVGTANITITSVAPVGNGFSASGGSNVTLVPNQSVTVTIKFAPTLAGSISGSLSISSNASNSVLTVGLSGNAIAQSVTHHVALNWQPSASSVIGYYVYRGISATSLSKLTGSIDLSASYTDTNVAGGQTYFYAVTSVDGNNVESSPSNQVSVTIPK